MQKVIEQACLSIKMRNINFITTRRLITSVMWLELSTSHIVTSSTSHVAYVYDLIVHHVQPARLTSIRCKIRHRLT